MLFDSIDLLALFGVYAGIISPNRSLYIMANLGGPTTIPVTSRPFQSF